MKHVYVLVLFIFFATSCSTIKVSDRNEKDLSINLNNAQTLSGKYSNKNSGTTSNYSELLWRSINDKTNNIRNFDKAIVRIEATNENRLDLSLLSNDSLIEKIQLKGNYRKGHFFINRQVDVSFKYGIWTLGDKKMCIGLSNENNLVLLTSDQTTVLLIAFPIGGDGYSNRVNSFQRIN